MMITTTMMACVNDVDVAMTRKATTRITMTMRRRVLTKRSKAATIAQKARYKGRNRIKAMPRAMISSLMRNYSFTSRYYNIPTNLSRVALWETSFLLHQILIGSLSKGVFERRTSTESEVFSLLTCLDDIKFVFLSFFTVIEAI